MYNPSMKRIQIHIDEELDAAAAREASRRGISKAALLRSSLAREVQVESSDSDAWGDLIGWLDDGPVEDIDEIVYGDRN